MGYLENNWTLSDDQLIDSAGLTDATNVVDLQVPRDIGRGSPLFLQMHVTQSFTSNSTGAGTATLQLVPLYMTSAAYENLVIPWQSGELTVELGELAEGSVYSFHLTPFQRGAVFGAYGGDLTVAQDLLRTTLGSAAVNGLPFFGLRYRVTFAGGPDAPTTVSGRVTTRLALDMPATPPIYPASTET